MRKTFKSLTDQKYNVLSRKSRPNILRTGSHTRQRYFQISTNKKKSENLICHDKSVTGLEYNKNISKISALFFRLLYHLSSKPSKVLDSLLFPRPCGILQGHIMVYGVYYRCLIEICSGTNQTFLRRWFVSYFGIGRSR